jgi:hypothetical protein
MPLFSRDRPPLIEYSPRPGDPVRFDQEEEYVVCERRGGLASSLEDTYYDEGTARELVRSQESRALLGLAVERLRARDFHGAASSCVKALGTWESGAAWWLAAEVHRSYGDRTRADQIVERADQVVVHLGMLQPGVKEYYKALYKSNDLQEAIRTGQEKSLLDVLIHAELSGKTLYLREHAPEQTDRRATIAQWLDTWGLAFPDTKKSLNCPSCGNLIEPNRSLSATLYWCSCGFMHSVPH